MKTTQFNGYSQQCQTKKGTPACGMKLITGEKALTYYEQRLGSKIKANEALDKFTKGLEAATQDIKLVAKLDIDEKSMGKPELFVLKEETPRFSRRFFSSFSNLDGRQDEVKFCRERSKLIRDLSRPIEL